MDFGILAIAFNIAKMFNIKAKSGSLNASDILNAVFVIYFFITTQIIPEKSIRKINLRILPFLLKPAA
jgi:hypothetical protein